MLPALLPIKNIVKSKIEDGVNLFLPRPQFDDEEKEKELEKREGMELLTLYLVDDEPIILKGLLETYDWNKMGFEVVGWARDGEDALEQIPDLKPDVVLTDVRMKKMDGLTLIEKIKEKSVKTNFVVISAYRDFEYAQKACANGALSYLVKPIDDEELERTMSEIYEMCTERKFKEKNYTLWEKILLEDQDNFLNQMVGKYLDDAVEETEIEEFMTSLLKREVTEHCFAVAAAGVDIVQRVVNQKDFNMKQYLLETSLYKKLKESYSAVWTKKTPEGAACYIVDLGAEGHRESLKILLTDFQKEMKGDMISALSGSAKGIRGMKSAYAEALELFELAAEAGAGMILIDSQEPAKKKAKYSLDIESQMLGALRKNDGEALKKAFEKFVYMLPDEENKIRIYLRRLAVRVEFAIEESSGLTEELRQSFENFYHTVDHVNPTKLVNILFSLFGHIIEWRSSAAEAAPDQYLKEYIPVALSYIQEHLQEEDLSITNVSEHVYLNPVYFGRLFKSVMSCPFKRYIQNMRMEKAKELLAEGGNSVADICERVGIPNPSYFSQLFKQYTGILPSEYKRSTEL